MILQTDPSLSPDNQKNYNTGALGVSVMDPQTAALNELKKRRLAQSEGANSRAPLPLNGRVVLTDQTDAKVCCCPCAATLCLLTTAFVLSCCNNKYYK